MKWTKIVVIYRLNFHQIPVVQVMSLQWIHFHVNLHSAQSEGLHPTQCNSILIKQRGSRAWMKEYMRCLMLQGWIIHRDLFHLMLTRMEHFIKHNRPFLFSSLISHHLATPIRFDPWFHPTFCSPSLRYSCHHTISTEVKWWCLVQSSKLLDFLQPLCSHRSFDHRFTRFCKDPLVTRTLLCHSTVIPASKLKNRPVCCLTLKVRNLNIFWPTRPQRLSSQAQQWVSRKTNLVLSYRLLPPAVVHSK